MTYGLGSVADDLPSFVVMATGTGSSGAPRIGVTAFCQVTYAGTPLRSTGDPILFVSNPPGIDAKLQRESINLAQQLNHEQLEVLGDPQIATRIAAYETAYRMQSRAPELTDLSGESQHTLDMYGVEGGKPSFAKNCLLARRLVERGVRFVNVYHGNWDHHSNVEGGLREECGTTDRATAALVKDLKQRGLLGETLVIWGGEFGRTPMVEL